MRQAPAQELQTDVWGATQGVLDSFGRHKDDHPELDMIPLNWTLMFSTARLSAAVGRVDWKICRRSYACDDDVGTTSSCASQGTSQETPPHLRLSEEVQQCSHSFSHRDSRLF
jgi:hypothetical protein